MITPILIAIWVAIAMIALGGFIGLIWKRQWTLVIVNAALALLYGSLIFWKSQHIYDNFDEAIYYFLSYGLCTTHSLALLIQALAVADKSNS